MKDAPTLTYNIVDPAEIKPVGGQMLVRKIDPPTETESGIILADVDKDMKAPRYATVISVSREVVNEDGTRHPHDCSPGDKVLYSYMFGQDVGVDEDGEVLMLLHEENVTAIVEE